MKKTAILVAALVLTAGIVQGGSPKTLGTAFGTMSTAQNIGMGNGDFGLGVGAASQNSFFGFFAYGMSATSEGRIKVGLSDDDGKHSNTEMTFGLDFHLQMLDYDATRQDPLDLAVGGFMEYLGDVVQVGADILGSYPIELNNNTTLTPYGRFNVRLERRKTDTDTESGLKFGLSLGTGWDMTKNFGLYGEFQFDGNDGLFLGLRYRVL